MAVFQVPLWAVTDPWTRVIMEEKGLPQDRLRVTGFPVNPVLGVLAEEHPLSWKEGSRSGCFTLPSVPHGMRGRSWRVCWMRIPPCM